MITRINQFTAKAGSEAPLHEFLQAVITALSHCPGCVSARLLRNLDDPAQLAIIEEWQSVDAHKQAAKAIPPETLRAAMALLGAPPSGTYYRA